MLREPFSYVLGLLANALTSPLKDYHLATYPGEGDWGCCSLPALLQLSISSRVLRELRVGLGERGKEIRTRDESSSFMNDCSQS